MSTRSTVLASIALLIALLTYSTWSPSAARTPQDLLDLDLVFADRWRRDAGLQSLNLLSSDSNAGWEEVGDGSASDGGISSNTSNSAFPSLTIGPNGTPYIAWHDGGQRSIYVKHWNGAVWGEVGDGSAAGDGIDGNTALSDSPTLAIAPDGTPYVAWSDRSDGLDDEIYVKRFNGSDWGEVGTSSASGGGISDNTEESELPSLAIAANGTPYLAWCDGPLGAYEIFVQRWNGSTWEEVGNGSASSGGISKNAGQSVEPSLAVAPSNAPFIAWSDNSNGNFEIYVRKWNGSSWVEVGSGSATDGGVSNNNGDSSSPSLAFSSDGTAYVAWADNSNGNFEIYVRKWNGSSWAEVGSGSASGGGISNNSGFSSWPSLVVAPDGIPYVAWYDNTSGDYEVYVRRWSGSDWKEVGDGSASAGGISDNTGRSHAPSLAIDSNGTIYIAWDDDTSSNYEIYARRWIEGASSNPTPFLSSPCGSNCQVTAYFDHCYPTYRNAPNCCSDDPFKKMCPYWTADCEQDAWYPDSGWDFQCGQPDTGKCWWYSGHNGYDYAGFDVILAAAAGQVAYAGCADPRDVYPTCNRSYGIVVDIDHENGYLTRYGHLRSATVAMGNPVSTGEPIGFVGDTGNSTGPHLHFGVYEDVNNNGQIDSGDRAVDPYGPNPPQADLWRTYDAGASSYWLWEEFPPTSKSITPAVGGELASSTRDVVVNVPSSAVMSDTVLYYTSVPEPPYHTISGSGDAAIASKSTTTASANHTFSLSAVDASGIPVHTLVVSATLVISYTDSDLTYVNENTLGIYLWDESDGAWASLPSSANLTGKTVFATITTLGIYSLRGQPSNSPPTVLSIDPVDGDNTIDTQIIVTGANFLNRPFVQVGDWHLPDVHFVSATTLTATIPAGLDAGTYHVVIENPDGQSATLPAAFTSIGRVSLPLVLRNY